MRILGTLLPALVLWACAPATTPASEGPLGVAITVEEVRVGPFEEQIKATALAQAQHDALLVAEVPAQVQRRRYKVGDRVAGGSPLLAIDSAVLDAGVAESRSRQQQAEDALALRRHELTSAETLHAEGRLADRMLLEARLGFSAAEADLQGAKAAVVELRDARRRAAIPAPFSGQVSAWMVDQGDRLLPGSPVARLVAVDPIRVAFGATERQSAQLRSGQVARLRLRDSEQLLVGEVTSVAPAADPQARTWTVEVSAPNPARSLRPGVIAEVEVVVGGGDAALMVPHEAWDPDGGAVFVISDNTAHVRRVQVGPRHGNLLVIEEGLQAGEQVAVGGRANLSDGVAVVIKPKQVPRNAQVLDDAP